MEGRKWPHSHGCRPTEAIFTWTCHAGACASSQQDSWVLRRRKQMLAILLKPGLRNPTMSLVLHSIGQSSDRPSQDSNEGETKVTCAYRGKEKNVLFPECLQLRYHGCCDVLNRCKTFTFHGHFHFGKSQKSYSATSSE